MNEQEISSVFRYRQDLDLLLRKRVFVYGSKWWWEGTLVSYIRANGIWLTAPILVITRMSSHGKYTESETLPTSKLWVPAQKIQAVYPVEQPTP